MIHIKCRYLLMLILAAQIRHRLRHRFTKRLECITLLPVAWQWHFGVGDQQQVSKTLFWGIAWEYLYGNGTF